MRKSLCKVTFDMYQGALASFLNVLDYKHLPGGTEEKYEEPQDSLYLERYSNLTPFEQKTIVAAISDWSVCWNHSSGDSYRIVSGQT
jgi:hypothetical protein